MVSAGLLHGCSESHGQESTKRLQLRDFWLERTIGKGNFGKVMVACLRRDMRRVFAVKKVCKLAMAKRGDKVVEHTEAEVRVLQATSHPFIVDLHCVFHSARSWYLVMEFCQGGDLFFHLSRARCFAESTCRFYAAEITLALGYLHSLSVLYRDLKSENVVLDAYGHCKLTDMGLCKENIHSSRAAMTVCGTPEYAAPEMFKREGYGLAADWYSLGALLFEMLTGLPPFYSECRRTLVAWKLTAVLAIPAVVSPVAREFIKALLERNPEKRLGFGSRDVSDIQAAPYFLETDWDALLHKDLQPPIRPHLRGAGDVRYFEDEFKKAPLSNLSAASSILPETCSEDKQGNIAETTSTRSPSADTLSEHRESSPDGSS
jgi:serine/threonine protein kinase